MEQGVERYKRAAAQYDGANINFMLAEYCGKDGWKLRRWKDGE